MPSVPGFGNPAWRTAWEPLWVRLAPEAPGMGDRLGTPLGATGSRGSRHGGPPGNPFGCDWLLHKLYLSFTYTAW